MKAKLSRLLRIISSYVPQSLPQNEAAVREWIADLLDLARLPNNSSFQIAIASMVLHLNAGTLRASKQGFIKQLKRSIANQSAYNVMTDLKEQEKKAADERKLQEASGQVVQEAQG